MKSKNFIKDVSIEYFKGVDFSNDTTHNILDTSIITHQDQWDKEIELKLNSILHRLKNKK